MPETMDEPSEEVKPEGWVNPMQQPEEVVLSEATEPLPAVTRPVTDLAMDVMAGKWGVGQDRRVALSEAGHDVKEIEAEVTRILNNQ